MKKISVVVPTLNSSQTLEKCLASIVESKADCEFELIVVDGGSADNTIEIASKYADKIIVKEGCFRGVARNIGVKDARSEIICFTDSDCIVPKGWVKELVDNLLKLNGTDSKIVGIGGGNVPLLEGVSFAEVAISKVIRSPLVSFKARNVSMGNRSCETLHNPPVNSAYFKWVLEEVGGFGKDYNCGEDLELDAKVIEKGHKLYYLSHLTVYHKHRTSFEKFTRQMYEFGKARMRVGRKYGKFLQLHHFGPIVLSLMIFSPLFVIPLGMALLNGVYLGFKERSIRLFMLAVTLTVGFYLSYGLGEIVQLFRKRDFQLVGHEIHADRIP